MDTSLLNVFSSAAVTLQHDGNLIIQSALGRYVAWVLAFLVVAPASFIVWRKDILARYSGAIFFASWLIPLIIVPGLMNESVRISPDRLSVTTGFWFSPTQRDIPLGGLASVNEHTVVTQSRMNETKDVWTFIYRDGRRVDLNLPVLLAGNREVAAKYLRDRGVLFTKG